MADKHELNVQRLLHSIRAHRSNLDAVAHRLRTSEILEAFNKWDSGSWCRAVAGDALVRIRLFTEQNFNFVETMGVIAVARYIFELGVWLRLFRHDQNYGLVYFQQLLDTQERYFQATKRQLERESVSLEEFERTEREGQDNVQRKFKNLVGGGDHGKAVADEFKAISDSIDAEAARRFSIYATAARENGYGFQAHLIKSQAMPQVLRAIEDIAAEKRTFEATVSSDVKKLIPHPLKWQQMAQKVGKADEYDFIYSFASKLLHATPASITTDQKNLEYAEMEVFLTYIEISIRDIITLAQEDLTKGNGTGK